MTQLISCHELQSLLDDDRLILLDCRADLTDHEASRRWFAEGHIPGAQQAHLEDDLSGPVIPGLTGRHPLPAAAEFVRRIQHWGINEDSIIVLYDQHKGMFAARAWWLMRWFGLKDVRVLNGGYELWLESTGLESRRTKSVNASFFAPQPVANMIADAQQLKKPATNTLLLDARALPRYRGDEEPLDSKAGHIPGAWNADFSGNLQADGRFKTAEELKQRFSPVIGQNAICYCGSGVTACHNILAMTEAGLPMAKLYPGSWSEWITQPDHPIATGTEGTTL